MAEAVDILRDALFGNPPSPSKEPSREGTLAAFTMLSSAISGAVAGIVYYGTGAARAADTARPIGTIAKAADEADYYRFTSTGWVVDNTVYQGVAGIVSPLVGQAQAAAIAAQQATADFNQTIGRPATVVSGGSTLGNYVATFANTVTGNPKKVGRIRYYGAAVGRARVFRSVKIGNMLYQRGPDMYFTTATGAQEVPESILGRMPVRAGEMLSIEANGLIALTFPGTADGLGFYTTGAGSSSGTPSGPFTDQRPEIAFDLVFDALSTTAPVIVGKASGAFVAGNGALNDSHFIFDDPAAVGSYLSGITLYGSAAGAGVISVWDGTTRALVATYGVAIPAGAAHLTPDDFGYVPVEAGQVIGIRANGLIAFDSTKRGTAYCTAGANDTTYNPTASAGADLQIAFELSPRTRIAGYQATQLATLDAAVQAPTGIALRALLTRVSTIALFADSIGEHYYASSRAKHWYERFSQALYGDVDAASEIGVTNFRPGADGLGWYGLSTSGSVSNGTTGPIASTLILSAGASVSFTGTYASVGFAYDQSAGAGTLTLTRAGGGGLNTATSTAGTSTPDVIRASIATGFTGSDTYTLTASGGPVTLTALYRYGSRPAGLRAPRLQRMALTGQATTLFTADARIASGLKQASADGKPLALIALGTNNAASGSGQSTTPAAYGQDIQKQFAMLQAGGAYVGGIGLIRPGAGVTAPSGYTFDDYLSELMRACELYNVPLFQLAQTDYLGLGLTFDGLHPNDAGFDLYAQRFAAWLLSPAFSLIGQQRAGRIFATGSGSPEGSFNALGGSEYVRSDTGQRYVKDTLTWGNTGWRAL